MAIIRNNDLVKGLSGKFGNQLVFRTLYGKTVVSHMPRKPSKKNETEAQRQTRVTFREATQWARRTMRDPEKKTYYQQRAKTLKLPNAYTAAITEYMRKPKLTTSKQGNTIHYRIAKKGFALKQVTAAVNETFAVGAQKINMLRQKDDWCVQYRPDVATTHSYLTFTITDNVGRCHEITTHG